MLVRFPWRQVKQTPMRDITMANPVEFLAQVRAEANKVTWPTRRETLITTALVLVMVVFASIFFVSVDQALRLAVRFLLDVTH